MAWRIHDHVVRGEIDNRERGIVRGKVWLAGREEPVELELAGNAAADLAGCRLVFENPRPTILLPADAAMAQRQKGTVGDLTASRKVRVLDMPVVEAYDRKKKGLPVPEHMANSLYLEWFSEANGRVVIESADYTLTISPASWRLTTEEEQARQEQAASGFNGFMRKLSDALAAQKHPQPENEDWDEFDYEKFMRECDARTNKYAELMDKYMDHPDRDRIIAEEMGWNSLEESIDEAEGTSVEGSEDPAPPGSPLPFSREDLDANDDVFETADAPGLEPDPATEGVDWVRNEDGYLSHPLALRALEGSISLGRKLKSLGLERNPDDDLCQLIQEYQTAGSKLAGALDGLAYGRDVSEGAFVVACLKRALNHLHHAQSALQNVAAKRLVPAEMVSSIRTEFFQVREEILRLMQEFRPHL